MRLACPVDFGVNLRLLGSLILTRTTGLTMGVYTYFVTLLF